MGVLTGPMLTRCEHVMRDVCTDFDARMVEFNGEHDHVHLLVEYPPKVAVSKLVRRSADQHRPAVHRPATTTRCPSRQIVDALTQPRTTGIAHYVSWSGARVGQLAVDDPWVEPQIVEWPSNHSDPDGRDLWALDLRHSEMITLSGRNDPGDQPCQEHQADDSPAHTTSSRSCPNR